LDICKYFPLETDNFGWTPLHAAVYANQKNTASAILSERRVAADVLNRPDAYSFALLHYSARRDQNEIIDLLTSCGADANVRSGLGSTPLHQAAGEDSCAAIYSLHEAGALLDEFDDSGCTPLMKAAELNKQYAASTLHELGAKNLPCGAMGRTPCEEVRASIRDTSEAVFEAIDKNHTFLLTALIDDEASLFPWDNFDETKCKDDYLPPFLYALERGSLECVKILLGKIKDPHIRMACGWGAFQIIVRRNVETDPPDFRLHLCRLCADAGLDVNATSQATPSALTHAVGENDFALAALLMALGANINQESNPPLECVDSLEMLNMLVGFGADMHSQAAVNLACNQSKAGNIEMVKHLILRWPHLLNMKGLRGRTPLEEGLRMNKRNIGQLLLSLNEMFACNDKPN
jgi:ankyrin repeat protein